MALFYPGLIPATDTNNDPIVGATWNFYLENTTTTVAVFSDDALSASLGGTVTAGSGGRFVNIYYDDSVSTRAILKDAGGATIRDLNPANMGGGASMTVEQAGGTGYTTAASAKAGTNNRTAIQAAIDALVALGGGTLHFTKPHYAYAATARTEATNNIATGTTGVGLTIDGAHVTFKSTCGGTTLYRRAQSMADPATWGNWPLLTGGQGWRGGGIFLAGENSAPSDYASRSGATLDGVILDGGLLKGSTYTYPVDPVAGDGWDTTDKGIWAENDKYSGDIRVINGGGVIGFRGELVYTTNLTETTLFIRDGKFGETNGSCLNPNSTRLDVDGAYCYNANKGIEGWGGDRGNFLNVTFEGIVNDSSLQGGKFGAGTFSAYYAPTRITATITPYCRVDNLVIKSCGPFYFGAWIDAGKATLIDSELRFGNNVFADGLFDTRVDQIDVITDQVATAGVKFLGADGVASVNQSIRDVQIGEIAYHRTKVAVLASRLPTAPFAWYGSLGPRIVINRIYGELSAPPVYSASWSNNAPSFLSTNLASLVGYGNAAQNIQTTPALAWRGPVVGLTTTGSALYNMILPNPAVLIEGAELALYNAGPGQIWINGNTASGSYFRDARGPIFIPLSQWVRFRSNGYQWEHVSGGDYEFTTTVANLPAASADWRGTHATVTDSNTAHTAGIGAVVAAGGANVVPVFCNGTDWRIG